jgi:ribosomal protein S12 methylthiotransferase accessory factor YcaO
LGESAERYSALYATFYDRPIGLAVGKGKYCTEYPCCAFDEEWTKHLGGVTPEVVRPHSIMTELRTGDLTPIPSEFFHLDSGKLGGGPLVVPPISTGCAFDQSLVRAIWRALCEVLERDAMMLFWDRAHSKARRIHLADASERLSTYKRFAEQGVREVRFFEIAPPLALVPTVFW